MSIIDTTNVIIGNSPTQSQNLKITGNGDGTFTFSRADGSQTIMTVDGSGNINAPVSILQTGIAMPRMVLSTAQATTSGTSIDFTGIPSWVKRITVMFNGVSCASGSDQLIQIGSGSIDATGYLSCSEAVAYTTGFGIRNTIPAWTIKGLMILVHMGNNIWCMSQNLYMDAGTTVRNAGGTKTLSGPLDRVRLTNTLGDTFDAGSVNIMYEG